MSSSKTSNYNLNQWVKSDRVLMSEFNADNAKIDAALASKASASALSSLQSTVNEKASAAALSSLQSTVSALQTTVNKKQDAASAVKTVSGSYTGTGSCTADAPCTLNFASALGKLPELLIIRGENGLSNGLILLKNMKSTMMNLSGTLGSGNLVTLTWNASAKTVSWYGSSPESQFNVSGTKYLYFAIG